jgi:hypothetical protein
MPNTKTRRYTNFIPAVEPAAIVRQQRQHHDQRQAATINALVTTPATVTVDEALTTLEGTQEKTNTMQRSQALIVRLLPFSAVWLVLSIGVSWAAGMGGAFVLCAFAGLTAVTYAVLDRQEYQFSRNGLERHKVNILADLKRAEMSHQQELRRMALQAHLKMLGVDDDQN